MMPPDEKANDYAARKLNRFLICLNYNKDGKHTIRVDSDKIGTYHG